MIGFFEEAESLGHREEELAAVGGGECVEEVDTSLLHVFFVSWFLPWLGDGLLKERPHVFDGREVC